MADKGSFDPQRLLEQIEEEQAARSSGRPWTTVLLYILILAGIGAGLVYAHGFYQGRIAREEFLRRRADIKRDYVAREGVVRQLEDPVSYADERRALLKRYFKEIDNLCADYYKHPEWCDPEQRMREIEIDHRKGRINDGQKLEFERAYNLARIAYDTLRKGTFDIVATDAEQSVRLDFYRVGRDKVDGEDKLKADFFLTGLFGPLTYGNIDIEILNENKNMFAQLAGSGGPYLVLQTPENQIDNFPPGLAFGSYVIDLLPPHSKYLTMRFSYSSTTFTGLPVRWTADFPELAVEPEWIADAEKWMADVQKNADPWAELDAKEGGEQLSPAERLEAAAKEADRLAEERRKQEEAAQRARSRRRRPKAPPADDYFLGGVE